MSSAEQQIYEACAAAAGGLRGSWLQRLGQAERRRRVLRRQLEGRGLWGRCASEAWLASWAPDGASQAAWIDPETRAWHARMGRQGFEGGGRLLPWLGWALERPLAWFAIRL